MGNVDDMLAKIAGELPVASKPPASRSMILGAAPRPSASQSPKPDAKLEPLPAPKPVPEPEPLPAPKPVPEPEPLPAPKPVPEPEPLPAPKPVPEPEPVSEPETEDELLPDLEELFPEHDKKEKVMLESQPSRSPFEPKLRRGHIESEPSHDPLFNQPTVHYYQRPDSFDALPKEGFPADQYEVQSFLEKPLFPHEPPTAPMEPGLIIEEELELAEEEAEEIDEDNAPALLSLDEEDGLEELDVLEEIDNPDDMPEEVVTRNQDLGPLAAVDPFDEGVTRTQDLAPMAAATAFDDIEHSEVTERYDAVDGLEIMNQLLADDSLPSVEVLTPDSATTTGPFEITESDLLVSEESDTKSHPVILPEDISQGNPPDTLPDDAVPKGLMSKKRKETGNISLYDSVVPAPDGSSVPVPEAPPPEEGAPKKGFLKKLFGG
jgi:hypothetical protein